MEVSSDSEGSIVTVDAGHQKLNRIKVVMNHVNVTFIVDTGSSVNIINKQTLRTIGFQKLYSKTADLWI